MQPFFVGEAFTGTPGKFVHCDETVRPFGEVLAGTYDDLPEQAFYRGGSIDEVVEIARSLQRLHDRGKLL